MNLGVPFEIKDGSASERTPLAKKSLDVARDPCPESVLLQVYQEINGVTVDGEFGHGTVRYVMNPWH